MALIYNASFDSQTRVLSLLDKVGNVISSCEVPSKSNELTLTATVDNSSVKLIKSGTLSNTYEVNTGSGWQSYTFGTVINLNSGQSCKWRCSAHPTTQSNSNYVQFAMTGEIEASGNCNSMLSSDFENITSLSGYDYAFNSLFNQCTSLTKAPELHASTLSAYCYSSMFGSCTALTKAPELPATTLASYCYYFMFRGCTALTEAPDLHATTLDTYSYSYMFSGCTALTKAPELPATTLASYCYHYMFRGCTALTEAPDLHATTLDTYCCYGMFRGCTALTKAPELPATTLASSCYNFMFSGCTALTKAPELPATALAFACYRSMFNGCSSLVEVRIAATKSTTGALTDWLSGVSATGDFYCNPNATIFPSGASGIPSGWTRHDIANYPTT